MKHSPGSFTKNKTKTFPAGGCRDSNVIQCHLVNEFSKETQIKTLFMQHYYQNRLICCAILLCSKLYGAIAFFKTFYSYF